MSLDDCILYRRIADCWYVIPVGYASDSLSDEEFMASGWRLGELSIEYVLERLAVAFPDTALGLCYSADYESEVPEGIPAGHRLLIIPDLPEA